MIGVNRFGAGVQLGDFVMMALRAGVLAVTPLLLIVGTPSVCPAAGEAIADAASADNGMPVEPAARPAFDFRFRDINPDSATFEKDLSLAELYSERGIVLNFVASWCAPCWDELPHFQKLHDTHDVPIVCMAADEYHGAADDVLKKAKAAGLTMPLLYVPEDRIELLEQHYDHEIMPSTYVVDRNGMIRHVFQGVIPASKLHQGVKASLSD
jgi:thiol-disulfide isomerase/thioredoxin